MLRWYHSRFQLITSRWHSCVTHDPVNALVSVVLRCIIQYDFRLTILILRCLTQPGCDWRECDNLRRWSRNKLQSKLHYYFRLIVLLFVSCISYSNYTCMCVLCTAPRCSDGTDLFLPHCLHCSQVTGTLALKCSQHNEVAPAIESAQSVLTAWYKQTTSFDYNNATNKGLKGFIS